MKEMKGITLIALVITIVVLIILAGVTINLTLGENGIFNKAKYAKEKTEYEAALEIVQLKITYSNMETMSKEQRVSTIEELAEYMGNDQEIEVEIIKYYEIASIADSLVKPEKISGFLVKVLAYPKYSFKIGEGCEIESVSTDDGITLIPIDEFTVSINGTNTINSFEELLTKNGITGEYTKEDLANNKDGILEKVLENKNTIEYIFNNPTEYIDLLTGSQTAMTLLGQNVSVRDKVINNDTWGKKVADSQYRANFNPYIAYNENTLIGVAGGRYYYKKSDGTALAASFTYQGAQFMLVGKDKNSVLGYCTYNTTYDQEANNGVFEIEFQNETWYYAAIPYGWANGTGVTSINNGKALGGFSEADAYKTLDAVAIYMLNDYYGVNQ